MGRRPLPDAKVKKVLAAKMAGKSTRQIAQDVGVAPNTVTSIWHDPKNFAVVAAERAKRTALIGKVLDAVFSSLIRDLESEDKGDRNALRTHALDILSRGEPELARFLPGLAVETPPSNGQAGGVSLQELLMVTMRQTAAVPANGHPAQILPGSNGHSGNGSIG